MKVWITKYALTEGILEVDGTTPFHIDVLHYQRERRYKQTMGNRGKDWHLDLSLAKAKAEQMRQVKIASLKKQIAKLEKLEF